MNYRLILQYDGTRYSGWQKQGNTSNTIQERLETLAQELTHVPTDVNGSGRTDAGVHALGQVANFRGEVLHRDGTPYSMEEIRDHFNAHLPLDIRVLRVEPAAPRFHARLNAASKHYRYVADLGEVPDVFRRRYAARPEAGTYDLQAMQQAADALLGTHDFRSFCDNKHMKKSTVRTIHDIQIHRDGQFLILDFYGDGFLYHMVRILTGTLLQVGLGRRQAKEMASILEARSRQAAGFTAPACGLFLVEVRY